MAYRSLLRVPGAAFFPLGILARLPYATSSLATLVLVQAASGSYAFAGLAAADQGIANALGAPIAGTLADRYGHRRVGTLPALASAAALSGLTQPRSAPSYGSTGHACCTPAPGPTSYRPPSPTRRPALAGYLADRHGSAGAFLVAPVAAAVALLLAVTAVLALLRPDPEMNARGPSAGPARYPLPSRARHRSLVGGAGPRGGHAMGTSGDTPDAERRRLAEADDSGVPWRRWGPYLSERQWGPYGRTTARTATPGRTSPTTRPAPAPTAGARTASRASATTNSGCASRSPCGTAATRSSRSGCSASPTPRETTARTSRSTTSTSTAHPPTRT